MMIRQPRRPYFRRETLVPAAVCVLLQYQGLFTNALSTTTAAPSLFPTQPVTLQHTEYYTPTTNTKPPAVFLHGLLGNKRNFRTIATSLGERLVHPRRLLGVDLRHHGATATTQSLATSEALSYAALAQDVVHFLDQHDLPTAELIGHSVGGKVAQ